MGMLQRESVHAITLYPEATDIVNGLIRIQAKSDLDCPMVQRLWNDPAFFTETNCYAYGINNLYAGRCDPGMLITRRNADRMPSSWEVRAGLAAEGMVAVTEKDVGAHRHVVALYTVGDALCDYHFVRRDINGQWTNKFVGSAPTDKDPMGKIIVRPEEYDTGHYNYKFQGYYAVPEDGITLKAFPKKLQDVFNAANTGETHATLVAGGREENLTREQFNRFTTLAADASFIFSHLDPVIYRIFAGSVTLCEFDETLPDIAIDPHQGEKLMSQLLHHTFG